MRKLMKININGLNSMSFYVLGTSCRQRRNLLVWNENTRSRYITHSKYNMLFHEDKIRFTLCMSAECTYLSPAVWSPTEIENRGRKIRKPIRYDRMSSRFSLRMKSRDTALSYSIAHYEMFEKVQCVEKTQNGVSCRDRSTWITSNWNRLLNIVVSDIIRHTRPR